MNFTDNNNGPGQGTGVDNNLNHYQIDINVPAPPDVSLNERLNTLRWGPDQMPTYQLGVNPGGAAAINLRTVLDAAGNTVPNMFIYI
jgi:hypothetical protein